MVVVPHRMLLHQDTGKESSHNGNSSGVRCDRVPPQQPAWQHVWQPFKGGPVPTPTQWLHKICVSGSSDNRSACCWLPSIC
jgi:hypothetical protein